MKGDWYTVHPSIALEKDLPDLQDMAHNNNMNGANQSKSTV
jgi:hypothetical protein